MIITKDDYKGNDQSVAYEIIPKNRNFGNGFTAFYTQGPKLTERKNPEKQLYCLSSS